MKKIISVIKKEFKHIFRDKRSLGLLIIIPIFMLILFGYALNFEVKNVKISVIDKNNTKMSRELINKVIKTEYFDMKYYKNNSRHIYEKLDKRRIKAAIIIPEDFSYKIKKNKKSKVLILIDGVDSNTASTISGYFSKIIFDFNEKIKVKTIGERNKIVDFKTRIWYNPELSSQYFLVPGLIVYILMIITVVSTSLTIVKEREENTIEQLIVSPLSSKELIIGKIIPYVIITFLDSLLILFFGYLIFGVTVKGSLLLLILSMVIFLTVGVSFGLIISAIADSQQFAFMISVFTTILPTLLLSGFVFPIRNMAKPIQLFTYIIPARYFMNIIRGIIIKGVGFSAYWLDFLILFIVAIVLLILSSQKLKKKLS